MAESQRETESDRSLAGTPDLSASFRLKTVRMAEISFRTQ